MLEMVLGFPDDYLKSHAEDVNRLAKTAGVGPIVTADRIVRPADMDIRRQELQLRQQTYEAAQEAMKDPNVAKLVGKGVLGVTPRHEIEQEFGAREKQLEIMERQQRMQQRAEQHPLEIERQKIEIEKGKAQVPYIQAQTAEAQEKAGLLRAQKELVLSGGGVKVGNLKISTGTWRDQQTGKLQTGITVVDPITGIPLGTYAVDKMQRIKPDGTVEEVPVESPEVQKEWEKIKQDAGKVWGRYVKDVLKGRDLDWTDEKEVKRFQDYLQASGFITKMEKIPKGKRTIHSIIIIDPSDPKRERPIHGFPSEAAEVTRTKMSLTEMIDDALKIFGIGGQ
jgi:hypothetical protein